jgi:hypothetical protein
MRARSPGGPAPVYAYIRHGDTWYIARREADHNARAVWTLVAGPFLSPPAATLALCDLTAVDDLTGPQNNT